MRWLKRILLSLALVPVAAAIGAGVLFGPYVLDDQRLDAIVMAVALDWRDFGLDKAQARLQYELDHQSVGMQIGDGDCAFRDESGAKQVRCAWAVEVPLPMTSVLVPLAFESEAEIAPDGDLR